ncbi:MAG: hypothetical protein WEC15_02535 [Flavobacteriales bacterium]
MRIIAILLLATLAACETPQPAPTPSAPEPVAVENTRPSAVERAKAEYAVEQYFPGTAKDSLLANMITFIYKRPTSAINLDRTLPQFRTYYLEQLPSFKHAYHTLDGDGTHWFYVIRPARSVDVDKRGVGGWFRTNEAMEMLEFAEVFNTRIMPEHELLDKGLDLFEYMVANGDVENHPQRGPWVEWPDERLKYDREKREWRYVD